MVTQHPSIVFEDGRPPKSRQFDDYYFSLDNGLAETDYVFIGHNRLASRFETFGHQAEKRSASAHASCVSEFTVYETGFGTGLNFLATLKTFLDAASTGQLHFISFEKYPLTLDQIRQALSGFPALHTDMERLLSVYPKRLPGWHTVDVVKNRVTLTLWFGDVLEGLPECSMLADAWFLDGFSPSKNRDMWAPALYKEMARLSHATTTFATFTVAGSVRRGLQAVGFEVVKANGYGRKRDMCYGQFTPSRIVRDKAPWFAWPLKAAKAAQTDFRSERTKREKRAIVIGAGLAGATAAHALARKGWQVDVLERQSEPAMGASGNLAGAIHPLVTADWNLRSQFYYLGLETTLKWVQPWIKEKRIRGELTGLRQALSDPTALERIRKAQSSVHLPGDFIQLEEPSPDVFSGQGSVFFPQGGWVAPPSVISTCLQQDRIQVHTGEQVMRIEPMPSSEADSDQAWQIFTERADYDASVVVLASGALDTVLNTSFSLPIRPVKGQVTHLQPDHIHEPLPSVLTHQGYSVNWKQDDGWYGVTGATFEAPDLSNTQSVGAHEQNLAQVSAVYPQWLASVEASQLQGRVGFRPTTPDHLPVIGPIMDPQWAEQAYYGLSSSIAASRFPSARYLDGLYVSNGHGARGLMSVFLAAEIIADLAEGKQPKMPRRLWEACHPERFKVRAWRRGKKAPT